MMYISFGDWSSSSVKKLILVGTTFGRFVENQAYLVPAKVTSFVNH